MQGREILFGLKRQHAELRDHLQEWAEALNFAGGGDYGQCQHAVTVLRDMCRFLETEMAHHFREEEMVLYTAVKTKLPDCRALVTDLQQEHEVIRQALEEVRRELSHFDTTGELRELLGLGRELIADLRGHLEHEERALHPVVLREFKEADWWELRRLYVDSEVA